MEVIKDGEGRMSYEGVRGRRMMNREEACLTR